MAMIKYITECPVCGVVQQWTKQPNVANCHIDSTALLVTRVLSVQVTFA